ncbi:MAG: methyltransferase [Porticoccaceae bacterium]
MTTDRNFDDLAHRFKRNVYDRLKGQIRLAVLKRDLGESIPAFRGLLDSPQNPDSDDGASLDSFRAALQILDAGGGQGQLAVELARLGHSVDLCDISANMLELARDLFASQSQRGNFIHDSIQNHCHEHTQDYDVVLCHAVLEWVAEPQALLEALLLALKPGGYLSLTFYNVNGIVMKNLLRANFSKIINGDYRGYRGSLTPTWPRHIDEVRGWLARFELAPICHSGIRCFHDYILEPEHRLVSPEQQLMLELKLSREEPFRSLGRYIHLLVRKI